MLPSEPFPNPPPVLTQSDFVRLLMRNEPALRAYSRSLLPDWHLVDEVIQEASVTMWEKFDQLRDEAGFLRRDARSAQNGFGFHHALLTCPSCRHRDP
jgi:hypothetical protein